MIILDAPKDFRHIKVWGRCGGVIHTIFKTMNIVSLDLSSTQRSTVFLRMVEYQIFDRVVKNNV